MQTGRVLVAYSLRTIGNTPNPDAEIRHLMGNLANVRHVQFIYSAGAAVAARRRCCMPSRRASKRRTGSSACSGDRPVETYPVTIQGARRGEVIVVGNPLDEIGEVWSELCFLVGLLAGASLLILALLWTARLVARPMQALLERHRPAGPRRVRADRPLPRSELQADRREVQRAWRSRWTRRRATTGC
jgi:two-component system sensor histidine kinase UhpB